MNFNGPNILLLFTNWIITNNVIYKKIKIIFYIKMEEEKNIKI